MRTLRNILRAYARNSHYIKREKDYYASRDVNGGVMWWDWTGKAEDYKWVFTEEKERRNLHKFLMQHKVTVLGAGCYSIVVAVDGMTCKIVKRVDLAYEAFVEFCLAYGPCKYLPRVEKPYSIRGFTVYTVERLSPTVEGDRDYDSISSLYHRINSKPDYVSSVFDPELVEMLKAMCAFRKEYTQRHKSRRLETDMHSGNFMSRNGQIVITDPWV